MVWATLAVGGGAERQGYSPACPGCPIINKKLGYYEEHSASVLLIVGVLYDISWEKIC